MKHPFNAAVLLSVLLANSAFALWPAPKQMTQGDSSRHLASGFTIQLCDELKSSSWNMTDAPEGVDVPSAVQRAVYRVETDSMTPLIQKSVPDKYTDTPLSVLTVCSPRARSECAYKGNDYTYSLFKDVNSPLEKRDESYKLDIPASGDASLTACSALGLVRGLDTFTQLVYTDISAKKNSKKTKRDVSYREHLQYSSWVASMHVVQNYAKFVPHVPLTIDDAPAFPIRGFMLDTSRNFYTIDELQAMLDAASWSKFNQFHWHVVDAQSWPIEISEHPELASSGAYSQDEIYTASDVQDLIAFANARGIDVLVEFDTPGHTSILHEAYPDLIACFDEPNWQTYAAEPPSGQLRITDESALKLTQSIYESLAKQFPSSYVSTGGDEINQRCYQDDSVTQGMLSAQGIDFNSSLRNFVSQTHDTLRSHGKTPLVWDELALQFDINLGKDVIVAVWNDASFVKDVVEKGYRVLHAASNYFYLDCGHGHWLGNTTVNSWCDPFKSWQIMYSFDPYADLTSSEYDLIVGGEALLWSEQSDGTNVETLFWPRAAAVAEVFWTGATSWNGKPRDPVEALPRINDLRYRMTNRGIRAVPLQPEWCVIREDQCNLY